MTNEFEIRRGRSGDLATAQTWLAAADLPTEDLTATDMEAFLIASTQGKPVGMIGLESFSNIGLLRSLIVDEQHRGNGLGAYLVAALEAKNEIALADYDLVELNEAFAAQVLACCKELDIPDDRLNVNGGAIALGHPIGATGARIVVTLVHELARRGVSNGLATLCISGGMGIATAFHRDQA